MKKWTGFPTAVVAGASDIIVGLMGGTVNDRFLATSWLFQASNLADVDDAVESFDNISPLTTNGDILWFDGTNNVRRAIGTLGQLLAVDASSHPVWINNPGLLIANNLSDLDSLSDALDNLGLNTTDDVTFNTVIGTVSMTSPSFISTALNKDSNANALTAHVGGGQGSALALTKAINRITTVASGGDSVKLPAAVAGQSVVVINAAAANAMDVFPVSGEAINALSPDTALSMVANKTVIFFCAVNGTWNSVVTA